MILLLLSLANVLPIKMLIKCPAIRRWRGINRENCSLRPSDSGTFKFGMEILLTGIRSPAVSPKRFCNSAPIPRYRSLRKLSGTSNTELFAPFSMNTGSCGRSKSNNRFLLLAIITLYGKTVFNFILKQTNFVQFTCISPIVDLNYILI